MRHLATISAAVLLSIGLSHAQGSGSSLTATVSPSTLNFSWAIGAALPGAQTVSLKLSSGSAAYTAAITPNPNDPTGGAWLIATPDSGNAPGSLSVRVNPETLSPGIYTAAVTVTVTGVANPASVAVTLVVTLPSGGAGVSPSTITLTSPGSLTGTFTIAAEAEAITYTAASGATWLTLSSLAGAVLPSETATITVTANATSLTPQTTPYSAKVTLVISAGATAQSVTVTVNLTVNSIMPTITSVWPATIPAGSSDTTVTIRGTNFYSGTVITASTSSAALKSTLISIDTMEAVLPAALLVNSGSINLSATNPPPGGAGPPFGISVGSAPSIGSIVNAASFVEGDLSPGEIITIFGQNLGPATPVTMTDSVNPGYVDTTNGGITVTIDGNPAPILYGSATQINVQVPYEVTIGSGIVVTVTYGSAAPATTTVNTTTAAPGIFTLGSAGAGQALAINYDTTAGTFTINSKTTPVYIGQTIIFFVTGEGDYASSVWSPETGLLVPSTPPNGAYPQVSPLPTVTIGGAPVDTTTMYAGPIPNCILGMLEISAVVPAAATTGAAVPLTVTIGEVAAQSNVTLSVHP